MLQSIIPQKTLGGRNLIVENPKDKSSSTLYDINIKVTNNASSPIIPPSAPWIRPSM
jgi:hypothetical protein